MSRGPGRIERAIEATFTRFPAKTFSTAELATIVYPGVNRLDKKHRVSILRAAGKVAKRIGWGYRNTWAHGGEVVYYNLLNLRSYAMGQLRITHSSWTIPRLEELLDNPEARRSASGVIWHPSRWADVQPGGEWAVQVEMHKAERAGNIEEAERLRDELRRGGPSLEDMAASINKHCA